MATPRKKAAVSTPDPSAPPDATADPAAGEPVAADNPVDPGGAPAGDGTPVDNPAADVPVADVQATDPATGEPLTDGSDTPIVPLGTDPPTDGTPVIVAQVDPTGAAGAVLDRPDEDADAEKVPSRADVSAQSVLDSGTLTPDVPGTAIAPVETLDGHTVDPTGTADDSQPGTVGLASGTDPIVPTSIDLSVDPADRNKGVAANLPTELGEELVTGAAKALAIAGFHRDLLHQWVDEAYSDLQGQRSSAQSAGNADPYPLLVF